MQVIKYKAIYSLNDKEYRSDVLYINCKTQSFTVIHEGKYSLELPISAHKVLEFSNYFDKDGKELFEEDAVKVGHWNGYIKLINNVFVIEIIEKQAFVNMHEMYSENFRILSVIKE